MRNIIAAAGFCLGLAVCSTPGQAAIAPPLPTVVVSAPRIIPAWWAGPATVCHRGYYGGVWCRGARPMGWVPGRYDWRGFWIPGHWG